MTSQCTVEKLPDLVTLIHDRRRNFGIYFFEGFETRLKSRKLFGRLQLTDIGGCIDCDNLRPSRGKKRRINIFIFELTGELIEFSANTDRIECFIVLRLSSQGEESSNQENTEKGVPWNETSGQCSRLCHLGIIRSIPKQAAVYSELLSIKMERRGHSNECPRRNSC